ncbi:MAG: hypothetical protein VX693_06955 [Pseudomonadota bacterium]|nr:hypothetical protein [Pseudomonadota bacterium]
MRLIYISGYGRSGTTALSGYLSRCSEAISLGEISFAFDKDVSRDVCSCGLKRVECDIWGDNELIDAVKMYIGTFGLFRISNDFEYCLTNLSRLMGKNTVIDSSKNAWKKCLIPFILAGRCDTIVVHIKRNLRDVLGSVYKGRNRYLQRNVADPRPKFISLLLTFFGWIVSNITGYIASNLYDNVYWVKYENIFLSEGVCVDELQDIIEKLGPLGQLENRHEIAGNRTALT